MIILGVIASKGEVGIDSSNKNFISTNSNIFSKPLSLIVPSFQ